MFGRFNINVSKGEYAIYADAVYNMRKLEDCPMFRNKVQDDLDLAFCEFIKTSKAFKKAANKLLAVLEGMDKKKHRKLERNSVETKQIHEFLVQIGEDSPQIEKKCFGLRYVIEKGDVIK